jgi:hypothetical protein
MLLICDVRLKRPRPEYIPVENIDGIIKSIKEKTKSI